MRDDLRAAGVRALAHAGSENWFFGHLGASAIAAHSLLNDFGLPDDVRGPIEALCDRIVDGSPQRFGDAAASGADPCEPKPILTAVGGALRSLRNSGHGIIYATLGLRAMSEDPALCTTAHCDGITRLVAAAQDDSPQRYYGFDDYTRVAPSADEVPDFRSLDEALAYAVAECATAFADAEIDGRRHFFRGEKVHGVTYTWALCELERLGHGELARRGLALARQMLLLGRQRPPGNSEPLAPAPSTPAEPSFWTAVTDPFHALKLSYAALGAADRLGRPRGALLRALGPVWSARRT